MLLLKDRQAVINVYEANTMSQLLRLAFLLGLLATQTAYGQAIKPIRYQQEVLGLGATTGEIPFWMRANQYGIVPRGERILSLRSAWRMDYREAPRTVADSLWQRSHKTDWGWGIVAVANAGTVSEIVLPEAYVKVKRWLFEVYAGRRREVLGLGGDSPLGSGSYIWSGNALPMVKLQVAIPDFWPANSMISIKGSFSQGWFNNGFVKGSLLHQKSFYGRIGKPTSRIKLYGGLNHQVQWAGGTDQLSVPFIEGNQFPSSLKDYWYVIKAAPLGNTSDLDTTKYGSFDRGNRIGNHLGTVDLGMEVAVGKMSVLLYRQNIYEDGSLYYLTNIEDGLNGLRIRNKKTKPVSGFRLNELTLEYLNTFSQGGDRFANDPLSRGRDNYFNHGQYRNGWSYKGRTIGTPFLAPQTDLRPDLPQYTYFNNNRVHLYHVGISGQVIDGLTFSLKASFSQNGGTYQEPFTKLIEQRSAIGAVAIRLTKKGLLLNGSAAIDRGGLYTNNTGFSLGLVKGGTL